MTRARQRRRRFGGIFRILLVAAVCVGGMVYWKRWSRPLEPVYPANAFYEVKPGPMLVSVVEDGTLRAVNETVIRSNLEGMARILSLAPEGSYVEKGDLLVELDSSALRDRLNQQEIEYQDAVFMLEQANQNLKIQESLAESQIKDAELRVELSQADLDKYRNGDAPLQIRTAEARMKVLREQVRIAQERSVRTEVLFKSGNATKSEVEADSLTLKREQLALAQYEEDLRLIKKFDQPNMLRQMESTLGKEQLELARLKQRTSNELARAQADLKTSQRSLDLLEETLQQQKGRLENAKIFAPQPGLVVYAEVNPWQLSNLGGGDEGRSRGREMGAAGFRDGSGILRGSGGGGGERRGRSRGGSSGGGGGGGGGRSVTPSVAGSSSSSSLAGPSSLVGGSAASSSPSAGTGVSSGGGGRGSGGTDFSSSMGGGQRSGSPSFSSFSSLRQSSTPAASSSTVQTSDSTSLASSAASTSGLQGSAFGSGSGNLRSSSSGSGGNAAFIDWSASPSVIAEGAVVRQRQELIRLPDVSRMLVEIKIPESRVRQVQQGAAAVVRIENRPDRRFRGSVRRVALLPDAQSSWLNPNAKLYGTEVLIEDELEGLKPGVSARAEIIVTNIARAISVPIHSVVAQPGGSVCYVKRGGSEVVPVSVTTGLFNDRLLEITAGLREGDLVLLSPPRNESMEIEAESGAAGTNSSPVSPDLKDRSVAPGAPSNGERQRENRAPRAAEAQGRSESSREEGVRPAQDGAAVDSQEAPRERSNRRGRRPRGQNPQPEDPENPAPGPSPDPKP